MDQKRVVEMASEVDSDLGDQMNFLLEIDQLKSIIRRSRIVDGSRLENSAEHSWHLAMATLVLSAEAGPDVDIARALEMLLVHDIVEIDAGDVFIYDEEANKLKHQKEQDAADRIFNLLPGPQGQRFRALWDEYEARDTPTARFARAIDRLQPLLLNGSSGGQGWKDNGVAHSQTIAANAPIREAAPRLWELASAILNEAADNGQLIDDRPKPD